MSELLVLDGVMEDIETAARARIRDWPEEESAIGVPLGGTVDETFDIVIENGHGSKKTPKKTSAYVKLTGSFEIVAPTEGTWHLVARETVANRTVVDERWVRYGERVPFTYRTGWSCRLAFSAAWSEKQDTTLKIRVRATY